MNDDRRYPDAALLDRYFAGECSPEENVALGKHFGDIDPRSAVRRALGDNAGAGRYDSARAWRDVRPRMNMPTRVPSAWRSRERLLRIAASVVFIVSAGAVATHTMLRGRRPPDVPMQLVATGIGERRNVLLSDGTHVTLAPRSTLRFPAQFGIGARTVDLTGQALFSVSHDAHHPFSVRAAGLTVRVLGTTFDVHERSAAHAIEVAVASGRVWLQVPGDSTGPMLTARQLGHVDVVSGRITVRSEVAVDQLMEWRADRLRFDRAPLRDVVPELERWFDVAVLVPDSVLAQRRVSAELRVGRGATLDVVLGALTLAVDAQFVRTGRTIVITPR